MTMRSALATATCGYILLAATAYAAAPPIGETKAVIPSVTSEGDNGTKTLSLGTSLFPNDLVKTGPLGKTALEFLDNTKLEIGPNSSVKLDKFVFNPDGSTSEATINLTKGVFRFVSGGKAKPNSYKIVTPHSTLGIRGTEFVVDISDGGTRVLVSKGIVDGCSTVSGQGECSSMTPGSQFNAAVFSSAGGVRPYADTSPVTPMFP